MDCRTVFLQFRDYQKGSLDKSQMIWVKDHIRKCPDCYLLDVENRKEYMSHWSFLRETNVTA